MQLERSTVQQLFTAMLHDEDSRRWLQIALIGIVAFIAIGTVLTVATGTWAYFFAGFFLGVALGLISVINAANNIKISILTVSLADSPLVPEMDTIHEIVYWRNANLTPEEIAETLGLDPAQVHVALAFYFAHKERIDKELDQRLTADDARWDASFAKSQDTLKRLSDEALRQHEAGLTTELDPDKL
jgi:hypothetical protein